MDDHRRTGQIDPDTAGEQTREQDALVLFGIESADDPSSVSG